MIALIYYKNNSILRTFCGNPGDFNLNLNVTEFDNDYFNYGINRFDNILMAVLTVFQSITTEGWSKNITIVNKEKKIII